MSRGRGCARLGSEISDVFGKEKEKKEIHLPIENKRGKETEIEIDR